MAKKRRKNTPSRIKYEKEHRTRSCRLNKEDNELLDTLLEGAGWSYSDFVKAHIRKDVAMVERRVEILASRKVAPSAEDRVRCLEDLVYHILSLGIDTCEYPPYCPRCEGQELFRCEGRETESSIGIPWVPTWKCPKCGYFINTYKRIDPKSIKWIDPDTWERIDKPRTSGRHCGKKHK